MSEADGLQEELKYPYIFKIVPLAPTAQTPSTVHWKLEVTEAVLRNTVRLSSGWADHRLAKAIKIGFFAPLGG